LEKLIQGTISSITTIFITPSKSLIFKHSKRKY
jgi:hypothetical protein